MYYQRSRHRNRDDFRQKRPQSCDFSSENNEENVQSNQHFDEFKPFGNVNKPPPSPQSKQRSRLSNAEIEKVLQNIRSRSNSRPPPPKNSSMNWQESKILGNVNKPQSKQTADIESQSRSSSRPPPPKSPAPSMNWEESKIFGTSPERKQTADFEQSNRSRSNSRPPPPKSPPPPLPKEFENDSNSTPTQNFNKKRDDDNHDTTGCV